MYYIIHLSDGGLLIIKANSYDEAVSNLSDDIKEKIEYYEMSNKIKVIE